MRINELEEKRLPSTTLNTIAAVHHSHVTQTASEVVSKESEWINCNSMKFIVETAQKVAWIAEQHISYCNHSKCMLQH